MPDQIQRDVLPIPDRRHAGLITYDAKDPEASFPPIEPLRPPEGAPNVLVILLDDVGFGASSAFGGPCSTERSPEEGYHLTEDMTDRAIEWVRQQKALMPDKPFFAYFAPGRHMRRTTCRSSGRMGTRVGSTRAGMRCERRRSGARRSSG